MTASFWQSVCRTRLLGVDLVIASIVLVVPLVATIPFLEPGTGSHAIALVTLSLLAFNIVGMTLLQAACWRRGY